MRSRHLLAAVLVLASSVALLAQANFSQDYKAFTGVAVNSGIEATLLQSATHAVHITGSAAAIAELEVKLNGSTLEIGYRDGAYERLSAAEFKNVVATVSLAQLERVLANGGAEVASEASWSGDALKILANGGAEIELIVQMESADVVANGGAEIHLSGHASKLKVIANGSAEVVANELIADAVTLTANGGAEISVHATSSLDARANGGSDIVYSGAATNVNVRTNGGASVKAQ